MMVIAEIVKNYIMTQFRNSYVWLFGYTHRQPKLPQAPKSFLFICKGNVCRSVFAEHLAARIAKENGIWGGLFDSAGLEVTLSMSPPREALMAARELGIMLDNHRSKSISDVKIESFDMVLVMEICQLKILQQAIPQHVEKYFLLPLFDETGQNTSDRYSSYNIHDPFGKTINEYRLCYHRIQNCMTNLFDKISSQA